MNRKIKDFSDYVNKLVSESHIEAIALKTGFKQRKSIITPSSFLNAVFFSNAQNSPTLNEYALCLGNGCARSISKQAVDKRFNESTKSMLMHLLTHIMRGQIKRNMVFSDLHFSEVRIMDSSEFVVSKKLASAFPGYGGDGREAIVQVQLEYELLGGKVTELSLGSALDSDSVQGMRNIDKIPQKALLIRDLGYFSLQVFKEIKQKDLYFISRVKTQWSIFEQCGEVLKKIEIEDIKDRLAKTKGKYLELEVLIGQESQVPVRLIASKLTKVQTFTTFKETQGKQRKTEQSCPRLCRVQPVCN